MFTKNGLGGEAGFLHLVGDGVGVDCFGRCNRVRVVVCPFATGQGPSVNPNDGVRNKGDAASANGYVFGVVKLGNGFFFSGHGDFSLCE